jgi:hypothetical protein
MLEFPILTKGILRLASLRVWDWGRAEFKSVKVKKGPRDSAEK